MDTHTHAYTQAHLHMHTYTHIYICTHIHTYTCTHTYTLTHTRIHMHTHAYTHTHSYTHMLPARRQTPGCSVTPSHSPSYFFFEDLSLSLSLSQKSSRFQVDICSLKNKLSVLGIRVVAMMSLESTALKGLKFCKEENICYQQRWRLSVSAMLPSNMLGHKCHGG